MLGFSYIIANLIYQVAFAMQRLLLSLFIREFNSFLYTMIHYYGAPCRAYPWLRYHQPMHDILGSGRRRARHIAG